MPVLDTQAKSVSAVTEATASVMAAVPAPLLQPPTLPVIETPSAPPSVTLVNLSAAFATHVPLTTGLQRLGPKESLVVPEAALTAETRALARAGTITIRTH